MVQGGRWWVSPFAEECCDVERAGAGSGERNDNCRCKVPEKVQGMGFPGRSEGLGAGPERGSRVPGQKHADRDWET